MDRRDLIREMLVGFKRHWWPLLATDLLAKTLVVLALAPLTALALRAFLALGGQGGAVADEDILFFLLSPVGIVALLVVGSLALAVAFAEHATLVIVALLGSERDRVRPREAIVGLIRCLPRLARLGALMLVRVIALAVPFLAVVAWAYARYLTEHDINYYLTFHPPEWRRAVLIGGSAAVVFGLLFLRVAAGWVFAIPLLLESDLSPGSALRSSRERVAGRERAVVGYYAAWLGATLMAGAVASVTLGWLARAGGWLLPDSLPLVAVALTLLLLLTLLANGVVTWLSGSALALLVGALFQGWNADLLHEHRSWVARESMAHASASHPGFRLGRTGLAIVGVLLAVAAIVGVRGVLNILSGRNQVEIIAHRGASVFAPENTMAAVERALQDGTDWVEIDVQEAADGRIVVAHDRDLMKVAGSPLRIGTSSFEQLSDVDIGSWFSPEFSDQRLPLLEDVLERARGRAGVIVELKYYGTERALEQGVVEVVERLGVEGQVMFMSLKLDGALALKRLRPDWTVGLLSAVSVGDLTRQTDVDFLAVNSGLATLPFIRRARGSGLDVFVWTVNDPVQMSVLISKGAAGLITDDPALARRVMEERLELNGLERLVFLMAHALGLLPAETPSSEMDA
jgi:glycerophosphoryl diester phosphodiesterase